MLKKQTNNQKNWHKNNIITIQHINDKNSFEMLFGTLGFPFTVM